MVKAKGRERIAVDGSGGALRQGLPGLDALRARLDPAGSRTDVTPGGPRATSPAAPAGAAPERASSIYTRATRVIVRREKKGHGGKTATRIEGLAGSRVEIETVLRELKRGLGCGAVLDGGDVVVQGGQGERVVAFLEARGVRRVIVGS